MNDFAACENSQPAFLAQKQRRKSEQAPKWAIFGAIFAIFGQFSRKTASLFAKIERNGTVFDIFEKGAVVIALNGKINHELHE